jgi:predicted dienelactone hydrolase
MRQLEIALLVLILFSIIEPVLSFRKPRWWAFLPAVSIAVAVLQIGIEGYRWQMVPAYILAVIIFLLTSKRITQSSSDQPHISRRMIVATVIGVLVLILIALPPVLFPVPRLPTPTGPYQIGTVSYDFVDVSRNEIYSQNPSGKREVMVQIWYPASPAPNAPTGPWMDRIDVAAPVMASYIHLPSFMLDHLSLTRTNAYPNAPVSNKETRYPVVVYSHGWNGFRTVNANQLEALASHGYIAVSLDHTYGALVTVFQDGHVVLNNPAALPSNVSEDEAQRARETLEATYAADVRFVLDQLAMLNDGKLDARFAGKLDLDRVGLFGHSTGGGAIVLACSLDVRCKAGLGMDAWVVPIPKRVVPNPLMQPFLFMRSEVWATKENDARLDELYNGLKGSGYRMTIRGTQHYDFTLLPLLTPLAPALKLKGPLDGQRAMQIITDYLLAFFDKHLKNQAVPLLDGASPAYPEVMFEKH